MEKLFAYGTLKDKDIQETIFGRILTGTPDTLTGYTIQEIAIEEEFGMECYPIMKLCGCIAPKYKPVSKPNTNRF